MSKLLVVKVGTGVLTRVEDGQLDGAALVRLVTALAQQVRHGNRLLLVTSGAVGAGVSALGLDRYPDSMLERHAAAAIGQARLMHRYENLFRHFELSVAQVLLTGSNLVDDATRLRVASMIDRLMAVGNVVPIVNQNDSVGVEELSQGDNDMLSANVASLVQADQLILLTSVDGLLDQDGKIVSQVDDLAHAKSLASQGESGRFSIGGMVSKLQAVETAMAAGIAVSIGNGRHPERLSDIVEGGGVCTRFQKAKAIKREGSANA